MTNNTPSGTPGLKPWLLLILLSIMWGSSFILIKTGLKVFDPLEVGSLRIVSAGIFLLPWAFKDLRNVQRNEWKFLLFIGLMGSLIPAFLFAKAQTKIDSRATPSVISRIAGWTGAATFSSHRPTRSGLGVSRHSSTNGRAGGASQWGHPTSRPASTSRNAAASSTVREIGPQV